VIEKIFCECLYIDDNDLEWFKDEKKKDKKNSVYISAWYRSRLGITEELGSPIKLLIEPADSYCYHWQLLACLQHPQLVVFFATVSAIIGAGLGAMGVGLGLKDVSFTCCPQLFPITGWLLFGIGTVVLALGICPFFIRMKPDEP
jgi:hypothetical protein